MTEQEESESEWGNEEEEAFTGLNAQKVRHLEQKAMFERKARELEHTR